MKTLLETLHEIEGQDPPDVSGAPDAGEGIEEETGFELNEEDWATLKAIGGGTGSPSEDIAKFLQEAGLIQTYRGVKSGGWQLTELATQWLGIPSDDHA